MTGKQVTPKCISYSFLPGILILTLNHIHEMVDKTYLFVIILHSDFLKLQYEAYSQNKCNANQKPCCFFF